MSVQTEIISTHAPAGGATRRGRFRCRPSGYFYSRPCGRGDVFLFSVGYTKLSISTHAPAGGATRVKCNGARSKQHFYSRPCGRGDLVPPPPPLPGGPFLLTPLREGRHVLVLVGNRSDLHFYSRPCGRGDQRREGT